MIQFLQPAAFLALLGLLVPVLIHLWERREGRRVLFGSIRWLEEAETRRVSHLQFSDVWRFLLRCAILVLFTFLLADAIFKNRKTEQDVRHWVLIEPGEHQTAALQPVLDSLRNQEGLPVRLFTSGFPEWTVETGVENRDSTLNYWSLLRELAEQPGAPDTVTVLAHPRRQNFAGERPALPIVVQWSSLPEEDPLLFIGKAWQQEGQIKLLIGESGADGTYFSREAVPTEAGRHELSNHNQHVILRRGNRPGDWRIALADGSGREVVVEPLPERTVWIFYDENHLQEQQYLRAALRAAAGYTGFAINPKWLPADKAAAQTPETIDSTHWLCWLSDRILPDSLEEKFPRRLIRLSDNPGEASPYFIREPVQYLLARPLTDSHEIDAGLPTGLIDLLFEGLMPLSRHQDMRHISLRQGTPAYQPGRQKKDEKTTNRRSLHFPIWMLLLGLFFLERQWQGKEN